MRRESLFEREVLQGINIANTLQGGISEPVIRLSRISNGRQIELQVPGVKSDRMHVNINNNQLIVYYEHRIDLNGMIVPVPHVVYNKPIPYFIDANQIKATYEDKVLKVQLPFNELANGFHRDIPIES